MDRRKFMKLLTSSASAGMAGSANSAFANNPDSIPPIINFLLNDAPSKNNDKVGITVTRTQQQVAPDGIRLEADFSSGFFDSPARTGTMLDEQYRDIVCEWHLTWSGGSIAPFDAPVNKTTQTARRDRLYGPLVAFCPTRVEHGTWTATLFAWEPSSNKSATQTVTIEVADPDAFAEFSGSKTICLSEDTDFTGAPIGSQQFANGDVAGAFTAYKELTNGRLLFKRGDSFDMPESGSFNADGTAFNPDHLYVGSFGVGNKPVLNQAPNPSNERNINKFVFFSARNSWTSGGTENKDYRVSDLDIRGNWDILTETGVGNAWSRTEGKLNIVYESLYVNGMFNLVGIDASHPTQLFSSNTVCENWKSYPLFINTHEADTESFVAILGNRWTLPSGAPQSHNDLAGDVASDDASGPARVNSIGKMVVAGNDVYSVQADSANTSQTAFRLWSAAEINEPDYNAPYLNFYANVIEASRAIHTHQEGFRTGVNIRSNMLVHSNIFIATPFSDYFIGSSTVGLTAYNNMVIVPDHLTVLPFRAFSINRASNIEVTPDTTTTPNPVQVFNNTLWQQRSRANNLNAPISADFARVLLTNPQTYDAYDQDNVIKTPSSDVSAPLTESAVLFNPRYAGRRQTSADVIDTDYATPLDAVKLLTPSPTSSAYQAISAPLIKSDLNGNVVDSPANQGAINS